jgi:type II secretory pathway pseudopilin PulG
MRRPRHAFTLVEMIVTIGVIVALMGVLIPTVKNFQAEARSVACQNNLRQIFVGLDAYRAGQRDILPMCEFLPVATDNGPQGGLPETLKGYLDKDCECWRCQADFDEDGSLATGTSYTYLAGLIRYTPQIQIAVQQAMIPYVFDVGMSQKMKDKLRLDAEAKLVTVFYQSNPDKFALIADSQDRHPIGDRPPRNGLYLDGSARIMEVEEEDVEEAADEGTATD